MKALKLTYNQSKKIAWLNEVVKVKKDGLILYVSMNGNGVEAVTWTGKKQDIKIILDDCFNDEV